MDKLLTAIQVADMLGVDVATIRRLCKKQYEKNHHVTDRDLPFMRVGAGYRFDPQKISRWIEAGGSDGKKQQ